MLHNTIHDGSTTLGRQRNTHGTCYWVGILSSFFKTDPTISSYLSVFPAFYLRPLNEGFPTGVPPSSALTNHRSNFSGP